jgi:hypothetical protein
LWEDSALLLDIVGRRKVFGAEETMREWELLKTLNVKKL